MKILLENHGRLWSAHVLDYDIIGAGSDVWSALQMAKGVVATVLKMDADAGRDSSMRRYRTPPEAWHAFEDAMQGGA